MHLAINKGVSAYLHHIGVGKFFYPVLVTWLQREFGVPFPASGKSYVMHPSVGEASKVAARGSSLIYQKSASQNDLHFSFSGNIWFHPPVGFHPKPGQGSEGKNQESF